MADTTTTNYALTKPSVNDPAGDSTWGPKLNANFDTIDTNLKRVDTAASSAGGGAPTAYNTKALPYTAAVADKGTVINPTGTGTLSLPGAVAVAGWYAYIRKRDDGGTCTVTPASGTIDGLASIRVYKEDLIVYYDSAASVFRTQGRQRGWVNFGQFTASSVASINVTAGAGDSEITELEFCGHALATVTSGTLQAAVSTSGGAATPAGESILGASTSAAAAVISSSPIVVGPNSSTGVNRLMLRLLNLQTTLANALGFMAFCSQASSTRYSDGYFSGSQSFASLAVSFSSGGNFSGAYDVKLFRP